MQKYINCKKINLSFVFPIFTESSLRFHNITRNSFCQAYILSQAILTTRNLYDIVDLHY